MKFNNPDRPVRALWPLAVVIQTAVPLCAAAERNDAENIRLIVSEVADAAARDWPVFPEHGLVLRSAEDGPALHVSGHLQSRHTANFRKTQAGGDGIDPGFSLRRAVLALHAELPDTPDVFIQAHFPDDGGAFELEDAFILLEAAEGIDIAVGQLSLPVLWEELIFETHGLAADQSLVNAIFNQGASQGVVAEFERDRLRAWLGFSDGFDSENTSFTDSPADWALTARAEFMGAGEDWERFEAFSSARAEDLAWRIGGAIHYEQGRDATSDRFFDALVWTGDAMLLADGWNLYAAGVGRHGKDPDEGSRISDYGLMVQVGVFVTDRTEPFARYEAILADGGREASGTAHAVTIRRESLLRGSRRETDARRRLAAPCDRRQLACS